MYDCHVVALRTLHFHRYPLFVFHPEKQPPTLGASNFLQRTTAFVACPLAITIITIITYMFMLVNKQYVCYNVMQGGKFTMPSEKPFLSFVVDRELLKQIDDFRFKNRLESRAEAVRQLIIAGLTAKGHPPS